MHILIGKEDHCRNRRSALGLPVPEDVSLAERLPISLIMCRSVALIVVLSARWARHLTDNLIVY